MDTLKTMEVERIKSFRRAWAERGVHAQGHVCPGTQGGAGGEERAGRGAPGGSVQGWGRGVLLPRLLSSFSRAQLICCSLKVCASFAGSFSRQCRVWGWLVFTVEEKSCVFAHQLLTALSQGKEQGGQDVWVWVMNLFPGYPALASNFCSFIARV